MFQPDTRWLITPCRQCARLFPYVVEHCVQYVFSKLECTCALNQSIIGRPSGVVPMRECSRRKRECVAFIKQHTIDSVYVWVCVFVKRESCGWHNCKRTNRVAIGTHKVMRQDKEKGEDDTSYEIDQKHRAKKWGWRKVHYTGDGVVILWCEWWWNVWK